jgi:hypothetical protein
MPVKIRLLPLLLVSMHTAPLHSHLVPAPGHLDRFTQGTMWPHATASAGVRDQATPREEIPALKEGDRKLRQRLLLGSTAAIPLGFLGFLPLKGMMRACNFWRRALPFFLRYKFAEWRINAEEESEEAREKRWDRLHDHYAPHLLRHILDLRGYFIKVGQFASSRNDFIPARILKELTRLQDRVPGMPASDVKRIIGE